MKTIKYALTVFCAIALFGSCDKDKVTPVQPSAIKEVATEARPGSIKITWTKEEPVTFEYVKVSYFDKLEKREMVRLASQYADSIIIPGTRAKYGDYEFTLCPVSKTNTEGAKLSVKGKSGAAPSTTTVIGNEPVKLTVDNLFADNPEPSEGPLKDLIDGKNNTFYHARWSAPQTDMPHYIVVKLPKKLRGLKFSYVTRDNAGAGNHPKEMDVYVSNAFDGTTYNVEGLTRIAQLSGLPKEKTQTFNSPEYLLDAEYQYIWFQIKSTHGGSKFFALAELSISELVLKIIDPEAPAEGD